MHVKIAFFKQLNFSLDCISTKKVLNIDNSAFIIRVKYKLSGVSLCLVSDFKASNVQLDNTGSALLTYHLFRIRAQLSSAFMLESCGSSLPRGDEGWKCRGDLHRVILWDH